MYGGCGSNVDRYILLMVLLTELPGLQLLIIPEDLTLENCHETEKGREGGTKGEL